MAPGRRLVIVRHHRTVRVHPSRVGTRTRRVATTNKRFDRFGCDVDDPRLDLDLDPIPRAAAEARQEVKAWLMGVRAPVGCLDDVLLIVSELVTNAVLHARTPLRLVLRYDGARVLAEVFDQDPRLPSPASDPQTAGGRGLFLVDGLSTRWGSEHVRGGKRVWAELVPTPGRGC